MANWTPKRAGPVTIQCFIDGRPLESSQIPKLEIHENVIISESMSPSAISPNLRVLRTQNPSAIKQYDPAQIVNYKNN